MIVVMYGFVMDAQLIQSYYWLSSAIAQAFAALIALTAMFYIYRRGILDSKVEKLLGFASDFVAWAVFRKEKLTKDFEANMQAKAYRAESKEVILSWLHRIVDEGSV